MPSRKKKHKQKQKPKQALSKGQPTMESNEDSTAEATTEIFVPGRICLFGEHSDWAGSFTRFNSDITPGITIVCGTNQGIYARCKRHPSHLVLTTTTDKGEIIGPYELVMDPKVLLRAAQEGGFWSYAAGVAYKICTDYRVSGLEIHNYCTNLPMRKGLSSSAAFCVMVARAFNRMYDIKMTIRGEMEYAYQGELSTPSRCGRMDQGCAYGPRPICMTFDGEFVGVEPVTLRGPPLHYVIVDLAGSKSTTEILAGLQQGYPFPRDDIAKGVHKLLGHFNMETSKTALKLLEKGDAEGLGKLMKEAQQAWDTLGTPACPSQLTAPLLHKLLDHPPLQKLIWGGKGVGSQGDGTAQLLVRSEEAQQEVQRIIEKDLSMESLALTISPSKGVRKAVIPAAGFSAALYPASKTVKTELFPVIDPRDGRTKPLILMHVEELIEAGIESVVIVVMAEDLPTFQRLFHEPDTLENFNKLPKECQRYSKRIRKLGEQVTLVVQEKQEGFGHALLCAKEAIGNDVFLLMIGHHSYNSNSSTSLASQMINAYKKHSINVVALQQTNVEDLHSFGAVGGSWLKEHDDSKDVVNTPRANIGGGSRLQDALIDIGMSQYMEKFLKEKLVFSQLSSLTSDDLKEMEIPLGHRKRMLSAFSRLPDLTISKEKPLSNDEFPHEVRVLQIVEKPQQAYAQQKLRMADPSLPEDEFLTIFGQYVLDPQIFSILETHVQNNVRQKGEFNLTSALDKLRQEQGLVGIMVEGSRRNIGNPAGYADTFYSSSLEES